jgi:hypothetical protein
MPAQLRIGSHLHDLPLSDLGGEYRPKPVPPKPDGLVADVDPTLGQKILDVAQRQRVSDVHHHDQTDDLWRAVEISERVAHVLKLARPQAAPEFALTEPAGAILMWPLFRSSRFHWPSPSPSRLAWSDCETI